MNLLEDIQVHDSLNPKIWSGTLLREDVRTKLIEIVTNFESYLEFPINIVDIQIVGSNASYNYSEKSDLDVHIIANLETSSEDPALLQLLCDAKKSSFNANYDIKIRGVEVELYVQDVKSNITSNGVYSVCENAWVKEPKPITSIKHHDTTEEFEKWKTRIGVALASNSYDEIIDVLNLLYLIRHNSIACDGEYGKGNQLFKELREAGYITKLKNALAKTVSKQLSLESLSGGQIVNRL